MKERSVQQMLHRVAEYPNPTADTKVVAKRNEVGTGWACRWYPQAQIDSGQRPDPTSVELNEIMELGAKVCRLADDDDIHRTVTVFFVQELDPKTCNGCGAVVTLQYMRTSAVAKG